MDKSIFKHIVASLFIAVLILSCTQDIKDDSNASQLEALQKANEQAFISTLKKHLTAVSNKDLSSLKSTMSPEGKMQFLLPGTEIINAVDGFLDYHEEWFQDTSWTFETKILNSEIGTKYGIAITEIVYREPERDGVPYFNRMSVSYGLEKINDNWYIIKDHASSIEKSTDKKQ